MPGKSGPDSVRNNIQIVARSGATVSWDNHTQELLRTVKKAYKPVILIWLGTCEVIFKEGKYIRVRNFPCQNVEYTLTEYRELRDKSIHVNRQSKIVFIECPYYSITKANRNFASQRKTDKNNNSKAQVTYNGNKTGTDKNNNNKAQVTYKGNKTGTDKNNNNKAQVTYKGNKTGTDKNNNNKAQVTRVTKQALTRTITIRHK